MEGEAGTVEQRTGLERGPRGQSAFSFSISTVGFFLSFFLCHWILVDFTSFDIATAPILQSNYKYGINCNYDLIGFFRL